MPFRRSCWAGEQYSEKHVICRKCSNRRSCKAAIEKRRESSSEKQVLENI